MNKVTYPIKLYLRISHIVYIFSRRSTYGKEFWADNQLSSSFSRLPIGKRAPNLRCNLTYLLNPHLRFDERRCLTVKIINPEVKRSKQMHTQTYIIYKYHSSETIAGPWSLKHFLRINRILYLLPQPNNYKRMSEREYTAGGMWDGFRLFKQADFTSITVFIWCFPESFIVSMLTAC